ncbi:carcinoembryonic antigen-related cell adhesion molecule 3 isoform X2 [Xenopus laevis]|uniref:Immunoglobulin V-set domain-containing protein n=2 Tax=Xenopus laevis TaxID=8355 RepID=A0A974HCP2_XENLA|nr:carcinoembryonic antigen-related cell adhesion molecule 3 isoform X2 [Xenopus laevis]OCT73038.1 hypothetical protein XELAEV_18036017mg [Xenopus laevis]
MFCSSSRSRRRRRTLSVRVCQLKVLLSLFMVTASSLTIDLVPQCALIGKNVTFSVRGINGKLNSFSWYLGNNPSASDQIINYVVGLTPPTTLGPKNFSDAIGLPNGSLLITNLKDQYSNNYTVQVQSDTANQASINLSVKPKCESGLSPGEIAGIVIGAVSGVGLIAGLIYFVCKYLNNRENV